MFGFFLFISLCQRRKSVTPRTKQEKQQQQNFWSSCCPVILVSQQVVVVVVVVWMDIETFCLYDQCDQCTTRDFSLFSDYKVASLSAFYYCCTQLFKVHITH